MKLLLLLSLHVLNWLPPSEEITEALKFVSTQDTITRLAYRVENQLDNIQLQIGEQTALLEILNEELSRIGYDRKRYKKTKNRASQIQEELIFNYQKQNAYRHFLTKIRQLRIQNEINANKQLKEIDAALKTLNKNKLPKIPDLKIIPSVPYLRDNVLVYSKEISSICNLTRSPDGKIIANVFENFFEYTDPKIASHFKESDFLQCQSRFIKTKKEYFLELRFILNSTKASTIYGTIDPSNPSKIEFLNGDYIYLETHALATGTLDPETGSTIYNIQYKLDREDIKNIRKKDIDQVTLLWTSGADQFEISKMDLLRNMFECIRKRKLQN